MFHGQQYIAQFSDNENQALSAIPCLQGMDKNTASPSPAFPWMDKPSMDEPSMENGGVHKKKLTKKRKQ